MKLRPRIPCALLVFTCSFPAMARPSTVRLTLDEALALADRRNAQIDARRRELEDLRGSLTAGMENSATQPATDPAGGATSTLPITERRREALQASAQAKLDHERVEIAAKVRVAFARVVAGHELVNLARSLVEAREAIAHTAERSQHTKASLAAIQELARQGVARARLELLGAERRAARAVGDLLLVLGATADEFGGTTGTLPTGPMAVPELEASVSAALAKRPELAAARREYEAALDSQDLLSAARRHKEPNRALAPEDVRATTDAVARVRQAHETVVKLERAVPVEVAAAGTRVVLANRALVVFGESGLASFEDARALFTAAFQEGALPAVQLSAALEEAYELQRQAFMAREELAIAAADFKRALGER